MQKRRTFPKGNRREIEGRETEGKSKGNRKPSLCLVKRNIPMAAGALLIFAVVPLLWQQETTFDFSKYSIMPQTASVVVPKDNEEESSTSGATSSLSLTNEEENNQTASVAVPKDNEEESSTSGATSSLSLTNEEENNLFPGLVQSGDGWSMWDRKTALSYNVGGTVVKCELVKFTSLTGASADMCVYPTRDDIHVSGSIAAHGRWGDCDALIKMWNQVVPRKDRFQPVSDYYFLEIGVNIGACLIDVLLSTNARIIGFEADPRNSVQVTTTLMAQPKDIRDRVAFFPIGLGSVSSRDSVIHQASDNRGNSVVDVIAKDNDRQIMLPPIPIVLERLDAILSPNSPIVVSAGNNTKSSSSKLLKLIKMDVQGFECNVMDGGPHIFEASRAIKTELAEDFLKKQNCSSSGLVSRLVKAGFPEKKHSYDYEVIKPEGRVID